jgi:hypothetical protein
MSETCTQIVKRFRNSSTDSSSRVVHTHTVAKLKLDCVALKCYYKNTFKEPLHEMYLACYNLHYSIVYYY